MNQKVQVKKTDILGNSLSDLIFKLGLLLKLHSGVQTAKSYNRNILSAKNDVQRLDVINSYITLI